MNRSGSGTGTSVIGWTRITMFACMTLLMDHGAYAATANALATQATSVALGEGSEADDPEAESTIVVTGQKERKAEIRREARSFSGTVINLVGGQFSRRVAPVCVGVLGIAPPYQEIVTNKINEIARRVGAGVAGGSCKINLYVLFSTDSSKTFDIVKRNIPITFNEVPFEQRKLLFNTKSASRWWYRSEVRDGDGMLLPSIRGTDPQPIEASATISAEALIGSTFQINLAGSVVVIDLNRAEGYPLEAVAAHAAMVSLVQIKLGKSFEGVPSILNIFAPGRSSADAPLDLTRWDYAFARSLYEIRPRLSGSRQKSELAFRMAEKLSTE
jgi:hypothetical protein